jgi:signal transduction histidine kinase
VTGADALLAALDALPHGVVIADAQNRLLHGNPAYWELIGATAATFPPGTPMRDLVRLLAYRGFYGPGDPEAQVEAVLAIDRGRASIRRLRTADGRHVREVVCVPLPGGGHLACAHDITRFVQAEAEAAGRADLVETVLARLSTGIVAYDGAQRVTVSNAAMERLTGMPPGTVRQGMTHRDLLAVQVARGEFVNADAAAEVAERIERDRTRPSRRLRERPTGEVLQFRSHPLPGDGFVIEVDDITALKRAEDEARRRAALLGGVLSALPHGVCVYGPDRRLAMFNEAYGRIMEGAPLALGDHVDDIIARRVASGEFDAQYGGESFARSIGAGKGPDQRVRRRPNGTVISIRSAPLPDGGHISVVTDVTALHHAERVASERAALLGDVLASLPHGVLVYGPDGRVTMMNDAYARIMEGAQVSVGDHLEDIVARRLAQGEIKADYAERVLGRLQSAEPVLEEQVRVRPNGSAIAARFASLTSGGHIAVVTDVTALHRAEEAARERAEMLETSFAAIRHGIAVFGPAEALLAVNERATDLTGIPRDRLAPGRSLTELVEEQVARGFLTTDEGATVRALDRRRQHRYLRRLPAGRIVEILSDPTPDGGFVITYSDVTALHEAEAELRRRATMLEASFAAMRHGIAIFDRDRRLTAVNGRTGMLTRLPEEMHAPGRTIDELIDLQVARGVLSPQAAARGKAIDRSKPSRYLRFDDDGLVVEVVSDPTPDGGFVVTFTDVTALRRAEEEVQRRAAMQDAMLGTIRQGVILYDAGGRVLATNGKTYELTGLSPDELVIGDRAADLIDRQVARGEVAREQAETMKALDRRVTQHYSRTRRDGRTLDIVSEPTPDGGYVITYSDVTEDRTIRAELERARAAAEAASEAKSRFLATMSHELRTPLHAVIGFSEAIVAEKDPARVAQYAATVKEAGLHLLQLVDDILDVARSQTGSLHAAEEPFDLAAVLRAALDAAAPAAAAARLDLVPDIPEGLPWLRGDAARLRQVLDKLLSNATKFTPAGGRVTLSAGTDPQGLAIRVADTGIGVPPEHRERMFEPFTQLDNSLARRFQGSGLGLHLARTLALALGATLALEGEAGPGIVAALRFPPSRLVSGAEAAKLGSDRPSSGNLPS